MPNPIPPKDISTIASTPTPQPAKAALPAISKDTGATGSKVDKPAEITQGSSGVVKPIPTQIEPKTSTSVDNSSETKIAAKAAQSDRIATDILSHLDWDLEHPIPFEFVPSLLFVPDSQSVRVEPYLKEHLADTKSTTATQEVKKGVQTQGKVWNVQNEREGKDLYIWVQKLSKTAYLGGGIFIVNGQEQTCRVIRDL